MVVFWVVVPCSLVEINKFFRGAYCICHQGDDFILSSLLLEYARRADTLINTEARLCVLPNIILRFLLSAPTNLTTDTIK
jgi:hypothetical protein